VSRREGMFVWWGGEMVGGGELCGGQSMIAEGTRCLVA